MPDAQSKNGTRNKVRNPAALSYWKRKRSMEARIDEVRAWFLQCPECDHDGVVHLTLRQLRTRNIVCKECGFRSTRAQ